MVGGGFWYTLMNSPFYILWDDWKQKGAFNFYNVTFGVNNRINITLTKRELSEATEEKLSYTKKR